MRQKPVTSSSSSQNPHHPTPSDEPLLIRSTEPTTSTKSAEKEQGKKPNEELRGNFFANWMEETGRSQGSQDFAKLIHTRYLSDKERILLDALSEYKRIGYKRTLFRILLMIFICVFFLVFTVVSIGCWSQHLELIEHLEVYDNRYVKKMRKHNSTLILMDCPLIGFVEKFWSPSSSHVDLFGKIISIISIRKLIQLIIRLIRSIRLKTTTEAEARKNVDETQKDLNGLAETIIETLCEV